MSLTLAVASGQAMCDALVDRIDAGSGPGTIKIYTGPRPATANTAITTQVLLGTLTFNDPAFGATNTSGVATAGTITGDSAADADGVAAWARIADSNGLTVFDVSVGTTGSGAEIQLASVNLVAGAPITMTSFTVAMGFSA